MPICNLYISACYEEEIAPQMGKYCKDNYDNQDICDGTKNDCVLKGKVICWFDPNCFGIMYNSRWSSAKKGVKMCSSSTLQEKPQKDWSVFQKCDSGNVLDLKS